MSNKTRWYKDSFIYQIYPRSFCDSNGDGIGDIQGIISKLDYIKDLGAKAIWLSPIYKSPNYDNGYDISDYRDISPEFGTLDDFKTLVAEMRKRDLKLIMDLVVNHTSFEHKWFLKSKESTDNEYRDYYFWRKGRGKNGKKPPNNWTSRFGGSAWTYDEKTKEWYLHLFTKEQPDLNWDNPKVRKEVEDIVNYWLDLGVDGFRCDVITYISKREGLPNGKWGLLSRGDEHFTHGPNIHKYLNELNKNGFSNKDTMIVGEGAGVTLEQAIIYTNEENEELDNVFHFEHMETDFYKQAIPRKFKLKNLKKVFSKWQLGLLQKGWNSLYFENHDFPRSLGRFTGDYKDKRVEAAKMLAISLYMQQGTPYIYQGQEIGMTNYTFSNISEFQDVLVQNVRSVFGVFEPIFRPLIFKILKIRARDNARTPMQWDASENAGFTEGKPWFYINPNYTTINVENELEDKNSILNFYKKLIQYRLGNEVLINGYYKEYEGKNKDLHVYMRNYNGVSILVVCNYKNKEVPFKPNPETANKNCKLVLHNYNYDRPILEPMTLRPYEALVYELNKPKNS